MSYQQVSMVAVEKSQVPAVKTAEHDCETLSRRRDTICPDCGAALVRLGACFTCPLCGFGSCG
ncbi:MAG: hypothetical protein JW763_04030 [candidate division Zixibacteria bacterium]|nr:hypothetical protein [candidate division Zixibacteria bacterium]